LVQKFIFFVWEAAPKAAQMTVQAAECLNLLYFLIAPFSKSKNATEPALKDQ
jgi:hypothetical protein